jgi:hypothetical protein
MKFNIYIFILLVIIFCISCNKSLFENFEIKTQRKLIHNNWSTKECQDYCYDKYGNNCMYASVEKRDGDKGNCYISGGFGDQRIGSGGTNKTIWQNKKGKVINNIKGRDLGGDVTNDKTTCKWERYKYRSRRCRGWWIWRRCWGPYYRYRKKCNTVKGNHNLKKGDSDCDYNTDCSGKLKCFQRSSGSVPGINVSGISRTHDFCYDENDKKYLL